MRFLARFGDDDLHLLVELKCLYLYILTQAVRDYTLCIHKVSSVPVLGKSALIFQ